MFVIEKEKNRHQKCQILKRYSIQNLMDKKI